MSYHNLYIPTCHGQFNNSLTNNLPTKKILDNLLSVYDLDLFKLNLNLNIDPDNNFLNNQIPCNYYSPYKFSDLTNCISDSCLSFLHNNIRSLQRNQENSQNHLLNENFKFMVIGLSETRITNADQSSLAFNPNIPGYNFEYVPTPLSARGVGMYIKDEINHTILERTSNESYQALWIELPIPKGKKCYLRNIV